MATYPTKLTEAFAGKALNIYYGSALAEAITNQDYEGEVKGRGSIVNVLTFGAISAGTYSGADMTATDLTESNAQLKTDQCKYFYFTVKSWDTFRSYIKNPEGTILQQVASELKKVVDNYLLSEMYKDVAAGNRIGTDYVTGTVTVETGTGAVTGSGTTFTAAMVGRGFKATGHTKWYRVKSYASATSIVIEDDLDDSTSAYTGGAISGGTAYAIEAATAVQVTASTVFSQFQQLQTKLDDNEVPEEDRWAVVPPRIANLIVASGEYNNDTESARAEATKRGYVGEFAGFKIYKASSLRLPGDGTNGWHILAGHKSAITFAMGLTENGVEDAIANFGKRYKSLYVYGAKVADERRKALAELYGKL